MMGSRSARTTGVTLDSNASGIEMRTLRRKRCPAPPVMFAGIIGQLAAANHPPPKPLSSRRGVYTFQRASPSSGIVCGWPRARRSRLGYFHGAFLSHGLDLSVIIPAFEEGRLLSTLLPELQQVIGGLN